MKTRIMCELIVDHDVEVGGIADSVVTALEGETIATVLDHTGQFAAVIEEVRIIREA